MGYSEEKNLNLSIRLRKAALNRRPGYQHSIWGLRMEEKKPNILVIWGKQEGVCQ